MQDLRIIFRSRQSSWSYVLRAAEIVKQTICGVRSGKGQFLKGNGAERRGFERARGPLTEVVVAVPTLPQKSGILLHPRAGVTLPNLGRRRLLEAAVRARRGGRALGRVRVKRRRCDQPVLSRGQGFEPRGACVYPTHASSCALVCQTASYIRRALDSPSPPAPLITRLFIWLSSSHNLSCSAY